MSFHRVAYGKGVNQRGTTRYVGLYKHEAGTDQNKEFHLGPAGYRLTYNYPSDQTLQPGIISTELEVTMIWDDASALETIVADIATGPEGKYFIGIHTTESQRFPFAGTFFVILPESMSIADEFDNVEVTFRGTDGLALLRNVDYNNDGAPYTDHQTILQHIKNVQSKHILFDVLEEVATSTNSRLQIRENIVSVDDELYSAYPPSTTSGTPKRTRVHHRTFHKQGQDGVNEYFSAYDVLESICLTFGFQIRQHGLAWLFNPIFHDIEQLQTRNYRWDGSEVVTFPTGYQNYYHFNGTGTYNFQNLQNLKGANWTRSFAPPAGDVRLIRNTQGDQGVIYATNLAPNTQLYDANDTYESGDQLKIRGSIRIQNENSYSFTGGDRLKRLIPTFVITLTDDNGDTIYYNNVLSTLNELAAHVLNSNPEGRPNVFTDNVNYTPGSVNVPAWSSNIGTYSYLDRSNTEQGYLHDANENFDFVVHFEFSLSRGLPTSNGPFTDLTLLPKLIAYDSANNVDNTYGNSLTTRFVEVGAYRMANGEVQAVSKFTHRAHTDTGRTKIDLGETLIGDRGAKTYFGGIEVYNGTDWVASSGWVTQDQNTPRTINQIVVEEVCAFHKRVKQIQAGSIVNNKDYTYGDESAFKDIADNFIYAPLSYSRNFTSAIDEVVLVKVGRNMIDITAVQEGKDTSAVTTYAKPNNNDAIANVWNVSSNLGGLSQTYHNEARLIFGNNWSSVIGADETQEYYVTYNIDGQGIRVDHQGETPTAGTNIQRRIYFNQQALATPSTSPPWAALHSTYQPPEGFTLQGTIDRLLDSHYATVGTNGRASYLVTYSEVSTSFLLDDFSEYQAAYSLRKLRTAYTGDAIRVQRASDSALQDIGFDSNGELDTTALTNFAAGGTLTVRTWYDQGGFGNDCIQSSVSAQPTIVASGQTVTVNGKPAVDFDGTNDFLSAGFVNLNPSPRTVLTFAGVYQFDQVSAAGYIAAQWSGTISNQVFGLLSLATASMRIMARFQNGTLSRVDTGSGTIQANTQFLGVGQFMNNHSKGVLNGTDYSSTNVNSTVNHATSEFALGHRPDSGAAKFNGKLQELVVWSQVTASAAHDRDAISQAIDDHYGVY